MKKVNIAEKLQLFDDHWNPRIIGELNGQHVKVAKLLGQFPWHKHEKEDELFYVVRGKLRLEFRDHFIVLQPGEFLIVPRGVEHRPIAEEEVEIMLFEPVATLNTGDIMDHNFTKEKLDKI
ncbi:cupin domain-containing protein [Portibacter marinus]|uniref:cupin domain-containing protein n=1 Tax=Portibacter marinus TaxID=2898660 RepID=UPI001F226E05|nr:cupin domain-containing protein [Portibacter marinus]